MSEVVVLYGHVLISLLAFGFRTFALTNEFESLDIADPLLAWL